MWVLFGVYPKHVFMCCQCSGYSTVLMLLKMVVEYCQCVDDIPTATPDILSRLVELLKVTVIMVFPSCLLYGPLQSYVTSQISYHFHSVKEISVTLKK